MAYLPGKIRAICDRCGFEYPLAELRHEWTGLMVCESDFDRRPEKLSAPFARAEGVSSTRSRPDNQTDDTPNTTTAEQL